MYLNTVFKYNVFKYCPALTEYEFLWPRLHRTIDTLHPIRYTLYTLYSIRV